jgi:hypothetical protein
LALGAATTGFGVAFAAAAVDDHGKISLLNQEVSGVLIAIGGGIVGASSASWSPAPPTERPSGI